MRILLGPGVGALETGRVVKWTGRLLELPAADTDDAVNALAAARVNTLGWQHCGAAEHEHRLSGAVAVVGTLEEDDNLRGLAGGAGPGAGAEMCCLRTSFCRVRPVAVMVGWWKEVAWGPTRKTKRGRGIWVHMCLRQT